MKYKNIQDIIGAKEMISPPGGTISETLACKGISLEQLALSLEIPIKAMNEITKGKAVITLEMAIQLENALGIDAAFWLQREKNYRAELSEIEEA